jgi:hypothetical protein
MSTNQLPGCGGSWVKASRSTAGKECVEMRRQGAVVEVRDSKDPHGPVLRFAGAQFAAWLDGADGGEFAALAD